MAQLFFYFLINMNNNLNEYYVDGQWGVVYNIVVYTKKITHYVIFILLGT